MSPAFDALRKRPKRGRRHAVQKSASIALAAVFGAALLAWTATPPAAGVRPAESRSQLSSAQPSLKPDVKIVNAHLKRDVPCDTQTWPYIEARCLSVSKSAPQPVVAPRKTVQKDETAKGDGNDAAANAPQLTPVTATAAVKPAIGAAPTDTNARVAVAPNPAVKREKPREDVRSRPARMPAGMDDDEDVDETSAQARVTQDAEDQDLEEQDVDEPRYEEPRPVTRGSRFVDEERPRPHRRFHRRHYGFFPFFRF